jgi:hypothetical protein
MQRYGGKKECAIPIYWDFYVYRLIINGDKKRFSRHTGMSQGVIRENETQ